MFLKELTQSIRSYKEAHEVILKHRLWPYLVIPGLLSFCYIIALLSVGYMYFPEISGYVNDSWIPGFMKGETTRTITSLFLWLLLLLLGYMSYKYVVLIFFSPVLSYLSEITETVVYGQPGPEFSLSQILKDIVRGLILTLRNLALTLTFMFFAWLLVFIPVAGVLISTTLIFLIQFFYDGFGFVDYTLERKKYSVRESIGFARDHRGMVIGVGMGFIFMLMLPVIGWLTAPSYATVAATLVSLRHMPGDSGEQAGERA